MAYVLQCDRCGTIYDKKYSDVQMYKIMKYDNSPNSFPDKKIDLCNDCYKEFEEFLKHVSREENKHCEDYCKHYRKPITQNGRDICMGCDPSYSNWERKD